MAYSEQEKKTKKAYNAEPDVMAKRVQNNKARRAAIREGKAKVGDGTAVDHKVPQENGGTNTPKNLRVIDGERNSGWRKGQKGYKVGKV